tara:strand:+ start:1107 stop:1790 length:684 start_codon:yes stop_codon:yes gene_type:complete
MGREFQYTPQGMADADQYRRSLGMRDGGPMGFRPLGYAGGGSMSSRPAGYANGDLVESNRDTAAMLQEALRNLSRDELRMFIENNEGGLRALAQSNSDVAAQIQAAMDFSGFTAQRAADMAAASADPMMGMQGGRLSDKDIEQAGNLGRLQGTIVTPGNPPLARGFGESRLSDKDIEQAGNLGRLGNLGLANQEVYPGYTSPDYFPPEMEAPPVGPSPSGIMTLGRL